MEYVPEDRILVIINDTTIHGSTRLQKYGFLLSKQYEKELSNITDLAPPLKFYDDWKSLWYGPFSKELVNDVEKCAKDGLVSADVIDQDTNMRRYDLTIRGRGRWRRLLNSFEKEMAPIREKILNLQKIRLERLLEGVYVAYPDYTQRSKIKERFS